MRTPRTVVRSTAFKKDYKREKKGRHKKALEGLLAQVLTLLANDVPLPPENKDHPLVGDWVGHRDCHLRPDLLLLYRKPDETTLQLVRLGSHSELFG
jgi:mRNA interferase YafQ